MVSFPNFFCDVDTMSGAQLSWAFVSYGYVLFTSSGMISDGSELLLLIPSLAGLVGSIVLPILGAVPDGLMVFFGGAAPTPEEAQTGLAVSIGALAGSTIMLLTIPWFLAILGGRVDIKNGEADYSGKPKLSGTGPSGIKVKPEIKDNGKMMFYTSLTFLIIQIPALYAKGSLAAESAYEHVYALAGLVLCLFWFTTYLVICYRAAQAGDGEDSSPPPAAARTAADTAARIEEMGFGAYLDDVRKKYGASSGGSKEELLSKVCIDSYTKDILKVFFLKYGGSDGSIDREEFSGIIRDLSLDWSTEVQSGVFKQCDSDKSGVIEFKEFIECFKILIVNPPPPQASKAKQEAAGGGDDDEEEEEDEMPDEWKGLEPAEQRKKILCKSFQLMGLGTVLTLIFSDPMVDVLGAIGDKTGIPSFYIAFVLAPLASNASELVAAYSYAQKKTSKTITISMSTLLGAAIMNNTYCLGIFFGLIYFQGLAWKFTAETIAIVLVQWIMAVIAIGKQTQSMMDGFLVVSLYPMCLVLVWAMENLMGLD
eukprot:gnl/TRDRNA2_/TRDRNA2_168096_c0_seq12.p1 gnl/TRDRNA2_/TRDRNA2_168096_c0~~gnl/TRDRNA2_/TRDRNA2_168096_c0_seq12.p1  ORF type:complete len:538 (-),score=136.09 gnl/TRDRNA2_/TRDRNA2_168096_c0_seq12:52-1665(-)